ncbi:MAG: 16S rRNA (uracil(1498)-N(3))-methyltransferase [Candidatus Nanopelagicales bacterium]|nr:16S rRNA (uracil(1498)-N(3))-methyltransferase [Candidatus Nanopelagicales bacterium]
MTPPLLLVDDLASAAPGSVVELPAAEVRHAASALRIGDGEQVLVSDGRGARASCTAVVHGSSFTLVVDRLDTVPRPPVQFTVVQALAKGEHGELAVDLMTQAGVDRIIPWSAQRSIAQWKGERAQKSLDKWRSAARSAAKQSRRAWIPEVDAVASTPAVASALQGCTASFVLHEQATVSLAEVPLPVSGTIALVVGPEGGIAADELAAFEACGATAVSIGDGVLRASLAGTVAVSVLSTRLRWAEQPAAGMGG